MRFCSSPQATNPALFTVGLALFVVGLAGQYAFLGVGIALLALGAGLRCRRGTSR